MAPSHRAILFTTFTTIFSPLVSAANKITAGPLATQSIYSELAYSTARPCAANCVVYSGIWQCGVNAGYHDLGVELGCGCSPLNACFCSEGLHSSATSYLRSCISAGCTKVADYEKDITSMLGLYDGYCKTANVEVTSETAAGAAVTDSAASSNKASSGGSAKVTGSAPATGVVVSGANAASTTATGPSASATTAAGGSQGGLSKSDKVALAASLGVGIPSLIIAIIKLVLQVKKNKKSKLEQSGNGKSDGGSEVEASAAGSKEKKGDVVNVTAV